MAKQKTVGDVPGNVLGMLSDLKSKLQHGVIQPEELALFNQRKNPFPVVATTKSRKKLMADLAAAPYVPDGWKVEEHRPGRSWKFNAQEIGLYLEEAQQGGTIIGHDLREKLADRPVFNANLLDWLLQEENQHLIPEEWKGEYVFFWGTIYRGCDRHLNVRHLHWNAVQWFWSWLWLDHHWDESSPAAVPASSLAL
jgi:hypothetical protein